MKRSLHLPRDAGAGTRQGGLEGRSNDSRRGKNESVAVIRALMMSVPVLLAFTPVTAQLRGDLLEKFAIDSWDRIPLASEDPTIALRLCEQPHADPCPVVAEIWLSLPEGDRAPQSLDAELAKWNERPPTQKVIEPARRTTIGGREAIETATEGEHSIHIRKQVVHEMIVFRYGETYAKCSGWSEPAEHVAFSRALHDFCASYDLSTLRTE